MGKWANWNVKYILKELAIVGISILILSNIISYIRSPELSSTQLPVIEVELLDGTVYGVKEGKPFLLHLWATWCPTCKLETPNIQSVSEDYEVLSIAVNSGDDEKVQAYMHEHELSFKVLNDKEGTWAKKFNVKAYPTTFIYDASGKLKFTEVGYTSTVGLLARLKLIE